MNRASPYVGRASGAQPAASAPHNYERCDNCKRSFRIEALDAKPSSFPRRPREDQAYQLELAADRGVDFDRLECADCYGPGYVSLI